MSGEKQVAPPGAVLVQCHGYVPQARGASRNPFEGEVDAREGIEASDGGNRSCHC